jgi:phthalate 4,5-dioxygenase
MLTEEDNALLTRVGLGTPMGNLLRRYWIPFLFSSEVEADGSPERVRLLGEDLLAFRDTRGKLGLVEERCPHRRASLYFGRNEHDGLRCMYHGWKFDVAGRCVDQPSEPESSTFKNRVCITSYPCVERAGVVWAYMGPQPQPPLPRFEWMDLPEDHIVATKRVQYTNWAQALEGDFDQSHVSYAHSKLQVRTGTERSLVDVIRSQDRHPSFDVKDTAYGCCIAAGREASEDRQYWRIAQFLMPFFSMTGPYGANPKRHWRSWIPIDDTNVVVIGVTFHPLRPLTTKERDARLLESGVSNIAPESRAPATSAAFGRYRPLATLENDFFQDRAVQRTTTYSGIPEFWAQDAAPQLSMGEICDRSLEHLGTSDPAVISVRRRLLAAAKALRDRDEPPVELVQPEAYHVRADALLLPRDVSWFEAAADRRRVAAGTNPDCP